MSLAWKEAQKFIEGLGSCPGTVKEAEFREIVKNEPFKQGDFSANYFSPGYGTIPDQIGMSPVKQFVIDRKGYEKILSFAKERSLTVREENVGMICLYDQNNIQVASLLRGLFESTEPDLFEAIGTELYGLKTGTEEKK